MAACQQQADCENRGVRTAGPGQTIHETRCTAAFRRGGDWFLIASPWTTAPWPDFLFGRAMRNRGCSAEKTAGRLFVRGRRFEVEGPVLSRCRTFLRLWFPGLCCPGLCCPRPWFPGLWCLPVVSPLSVGLRKSTGGLGPCGLGMLVFRIGRTAGCDAAASSAMKFSRTGQGMTCARSCS